MKKNIFGFTLMLLFSVSAFAQNAPNETARTVPADFKSDGCSLFPDCDYRDCCEMHDRAYYFGGTGKERWRADKLLYKCVAAKKGWQHRIIAPIMLIGVRIGGVSWLPTPFRWGFGQRKKPKNKNGVMTKIQKSPPKVKYKNKIYE